MNTDIEFVQKFNLAYNAMCKPLCQQLKLPQTAFDILMFCGNNPEYRTASDVVEIRRIKEDKIPEQTIRTTTKHLLPWLYPSKWNTRLYEGLYLRLR